MSSVTPHDASFSFTRIWSFHWLYLAGDRRQLGAKWSLPLYPITKDIPCLSVWLKSAWYRKFSLADSVIVNDWALVFGEGPGPTVTIGICNRNALKSMVVSLTIFKMPFSFKMSSHQAESTILVSLHMSMHHCMIDFFCTANSFLSCTCNKKLYNYCISLRRWCWKKILYEYNMYVLLVSFNDIKTNFRYIVLLIRG